MCANSTSIFSIEIKSLLRLNFDNTTGFNEKVNISGNGRFVFAVVDPAFELCLFSDLARAERIP